MLPVNLIPVERSLYQSDSLKEFGYTYRIEGVSKYHLAVFLPEEYDPEKHTEFCSINPADTERGVAQTLKPLQRNQALVEFVVQDDELRINRRGHCIFSTHLTENADNRSFQEVYDLFALPTLGEYCKIFLQYLIRTDGQNSIASSDRIFAMHIMYRIGAGFSPPTPFHLDAPQDSPDAIVEAVFNNFYKMKLGDEGFREALVLTWDLIASVPKIPTEEVVAALSTFLYLKVYPENIEKTFEMLWRQHFPHLPRLAVYKILWNYVDQLAMSKAPAYRFAYAQQRFQELSTWEKHRWIRKYMARWSRDHGFVRVNRKRRRAVGGYPWQAA